MAPIVDGSSITTFDAVPPNIYECRLESFKNTLAKSDQSPNVELTFVIDEGEYANRKFFYIHNLKPQSLWSFKKTCVSLGADPESFKGQFDTDEILRPLIGSPCRIRAGIQGPGEFEGRQSVDEILGMGFALN